MVHPDGRTPLRNRQLGVSNRRQGPWLSNLTFDKYAPSPYNSLQMLECKEPCNLQEDLRADCDTYQQGSNNNSPRSA